VQGTRPLTASGEGGTTRIAIASGKGGTGKTLVSTNLAAVTEGSALLDLDVEEPNCYIFAKAASERAEGIFRPVPRVDAKKCTLCGNCRKVCEFHAIAVLPKEVMVFDELCHGCGACAMLCPEEAITEVDHLLGEVVRTEGGLLDLTYGRLRVGEAAATPLIRRVKEAAPQKEAVIMDCPPGTACTAVASIKGADACVLVTEPTPFGMHDLRLALEVARKLRVPAAVFINKDGLPGPDIDGFCEAHRVPVVGRLPLDRGIAEVYSRGGMIADDTRFRATFEGLRDWAFKGGRR
jgi:MinD superfamily P-loop ATPase